MTTYNTKLDALTHDFTDEVWDLFHKGEINNTDEIYESLHTYCDNAVIYNHECQEILQDANMDYCFHDHHVFGKPENIYQAAYVCVFDYITESAEFSTMVNEIENAIHQLQD